MIYLHTSHDSNKTFLENLLKIKHQPYENFSDHFSYTSHYPQLLIHHKVPIAYTPHIADYLDRKYPYPCLIPDTPEERAQIMTCTSHIIDLGITEPEKEHFRNIRDPFITGPRISLLDLALEPLLEDTQYSALIRGMFND